MRKTFKVKGRVKSIMKGKFKIFPKEFELLSGEEYNVLIETLYKNSTNEPTIKGML